MSNSVLWGKIRIISQYVVYCKFNPKYLVFKDISEATEQNFIKFHMASSWDGGMEFVKMGILFCLRWLSFPYTVKTFQNQGSFETESEYSASGTQG